MSKKLISIYLIIIFIIILLTKCEEEFEEINKESENDDDEYNSKSFKKNLKEYLIEKKLFDSEEPVQKEELKKIVLDNIFENGEEVFGDYFTKIFNELADYFVDSYFKNRKEIKGKEIYDLIDIKPITEKFEEIVGKNNNNKSNMNNTDTDIDNKNKDFNSMNEVGEPTSDI